MISSLSGKSSDELAARMWLRKYDSSGIAYARQSELSPSRVAKTAARNRVLRLFSKHEFPSGLSILTMPGLDWSFEKALLSNRERAHRLTRARPERTYICAIERDEAIYRTALRSIPVADGHIAQMQAPNFASDSYRTKLIARFHRCRFEDLSEWYAKSDRAYDAAWLDFSGPVTTQRMEAIQRFWLSSIRWRLVITAMNARWDAEASAMIAKAGGITNWFVGSLPGCSLVMDDRYQSRVPMLQVGVTRATS